MPYVLSPIIRKNQAGLWGEGAPYESSVIYDINKPSAATPLVHYEAHLLKPHSLPHFDAPAHILKNGKTVDWFYKNNSLSGFFGKATVVRLKGEGFKENVWRVSKEELQAHLKGPVQRLLLCADAYPQAANGQHDPNCVLVLESTAAQWLVEQDSSFCLYGTSWKSTDFQPGSKERPIHKIFFEQNVSIFECLDLKNVPAGDYFWSAFPLPLEGASESPVCPVLFTADELRAGI